MEWSTEHDSITGEEYIAVDTRGESLLRDPFTNKSTAFTAAERADLGLDGLVPPAVSTMDQQLARAYGHYRVKQTPLERYIYLASLQDRNETLFFRLLHDHIDEMMPVVYTPVVGEACQQYSHISAIARTTASVNKPAAPDVPTRIVGLEIPDRFFQRDVHGVAAHVRRHLFDRPGVGGLEVLQFRPRLRHQSPAVHGADALPGLLPGEAGVAQRRHEENVP